MRRSKSVRLNRRILLKGLAAAGAAAATSGRSIPGAYAANPNARFLIVMPLFGGGAIIDSFLPVKLSECAQPAIMDAYPDAQVKDIDGSTIRAVDPIIETVVGVPLGAPTEINLSGFATKHRDEMMITTLECTSVNHFVAQHRALNGGGAWNGRTMQELVALQYGEGYPVPNANMAGLGYRIPGDDTMLPPWAYGEPIAQPLFKPLSLSGHKGIVGAPDASLIELARTMRNDKLDEQGSFYQSFRQSERLKLWKQQRGVSAPALEAANLIDKLIFVKESPTIPLSDYGLTESPDADLIASVFPDLLTTQDPYEMQAALAFLLLKHGVSVSVTLSPDFAAILGGPVGVVNTPLAFDGSHNDHRSTQAVMWQRCLTVADKLIDLLKATPFNDQGETMWDRSMIHFATDFGRAKTRPTDATEWGTAHNLNNGSLTVSPFVNGNTVLGGVHKNVDANTDCRTFGFNLATGAPDPNRTTSEAEHFAGIVQAMGVDTSATSLPDVPAMRKA